MSYVHPALPWTNPVYFKLVGDEVDPNALLPSNIVAALQFPRNDQVDDVGLVDDRAVHEHLAVLDGEH
ncbi:hypothetical protein D3C80_1786920 [compost metagenome]